MNRILKALGAFALSLTLLLSLAAIGPCAAAQGDESDSFAGYLVILKEQDSPVGDGSGEAVASLFSQATLFAAENERAELLPLAESIGIYKAGDLGDIQNLVWSGLVETIEPDYEAHLFALDINDPANPNDDYFQSQYQFNLTDINAQSAWDAGLTGENVTVAVIDTGLNAAHLDAPVKIAQGRYYFYREEKGGPYKFTINGVTKEYEFYSTDETEDNMGHGTMVTGIIAANTNNRSDSYTGGIAGLAPNATIMPIRCFTTTAGHLGGRTSNLIGGINYAVDNGANIINMSWGITSQSAALEKTINNAAAAGCILIAAAGNSGSSTLEYPAAYPNVISVGSTNKLGGLSSFSQRTDTVNVCAPGGGNGQIYSLSHTGERGIAMGAGTSFSAPLVAGAAALFKERNPSMTQADFMALLRQTSDYGNIAPADQPYAGCGVMDLKAMLEATGHTGTMLRYGDDGAVTVRAAHFPATAAEEAGGTYALVLIGVYNPAGHLLDSRIAISNRSAGYGAYSLTTTFQAPEATTLQAYFLDNATLAPLCQPVSVALARYR